MLTAMRFPEPKCGVCSDTGWKQVIRNGYSGVVRCECFETRQGRSLTATCGIPEAFLDKRLETFKAETMALKKTLNTIRHYLRTFPAGTPPGLIIAGDPGCGKTHLAVGIVRALIAKGVEAKFFDSQTLFENARVAIDEDNGTDAALIQSAIEPNVVVLDDLGGRRPSPWIHDTCSAILVERFNRNRPTIITTSATDEMFGLAQPDCAVRLIEQIGARARSKILDMCQPIEIVATDYRLQRSATQ